MKKHYIHIGLFIVSLILLTGFKKNTQHQTLVSAKSVNAIGGVTSFTDLPEIIISDITVIQGDKGQTPAERCGIKIEGEDKWLTLIQNASKVSDI